MFLAAAFAALVLLNSWDAQLSAQSMEVSEQAIATDRLGGDTNVSSVVRSYDNRYQGVKGDPLAFPAFYRGAVITTGGKTRILPMMNYEAYSHEIASMDIEGKMEYLPKGMIESFWLYDPVSRDTLFFKKFIPEGEELEFYGQILFEGERTFVKKYEKFVQKADYQGAYSAGKPYDEFKSKIKYFVLDAEGSMTYFKPNKKGIESVFSGKSAEVKTYLKKNKPDLKSQQGLAAVLAHLEGE